MFPLKIERSRAPVAFSRELYFWAGSFTLIFYFLSFKSNSEWMFLSSTLPDPVQCPLTLHTLQTFALEFALHWSCSTWHSLPLSGYILFSNVPLKSSCLWLCWAHFRTVPKYFHLCLANRVDFLSSTVAFFFFFLIASVCTVSVFIYHAKLTVFHVSLTNIFCLSGR